MTLTPNRRIASIATIVLMVDQFTKYMVLRTLPFDEEKVIIPGFFKFVHWHNTGAAWSLFNGNNGLLAVIAVLALLVLFRSRHYFDAHTVMGQTALGLIFGGILGNFVDRVWIQHVTDFLRFYLERRGGGEMGFPAFNVADSAICVGVGLIFILSWKNEKAKPAQPQV
jgi:signal peptidase II